MMEEKKKGKTRRDYSQLDSEEKPRRATVFGKRAKRKRKKKEQLKHSVLPTPCPFTGDLAIFNVPLALAVSRMGSHDGVQLPVVVRLCIDCINEKGLCAEGIHRISAPIARLDKLEAIVNSRRPIHLDDVHEASGLLKRFLRQLPLHILTDEKRHTFEKIAAKCPCGAFSPCRCLVADMLKAELSCLPVENYTLLAYIFLHGQMILYHREQNKMGMSALGLILQATLDLSQPLVRIFLLNASDLIQLEYHSPSMVFLFKDIEIKKYIEAKPPRLICEGSLPESEDELSTEESKQRCRLQQLHQQLKSVRNQKAEIMEQRKNSDQTPTLEIFEEKQLLAACTALREDIARHKSEIIALDRALATLNVGRRPGNAEQEDDEYDENFWRIACSKEEQKRDELTEEIISLRNDCCQLRAELELSAVKRPTLLVTRF